MKKEYKKNMEANLPRYAVVDISCAVFLCGVGWDVAALVFVTVCDASVPSPPLPATDSFCIIVVNEVYF
jgi:hypothetical protein